MIEWTFICFKKHVCMIRDAKKHDIEEWNCSPLSLDRGTPHQWDKAGSKRGMAGRMPERQQRDGK
jgi:hypothetical protein